MAVRHYHLVCEGFRDEGVNKTELSLILKAKMSLSDAQVADLMAARRVILARNLPADKAQSLGKKLLKAGLNIKAESADANQKLSAEELRQHLLDGGLSHYFAGRYRHPGDELETRVSLLILALVPVLVFVVLPFIGLSLLRPLLALHIWSDQLIAALSQLVLAFLFFLPAILLWPVSSSKKEEGIELDKEQEALLYAIAAEVSQHLGGPRINTLVLTEGPLVRLQQTPLQWLRREADLEVGLAHLQAMNLQHFVGSLLYQVTPHSSVIYYWCWSLYRFWSSTIEQRFPALFDRLLQWVQPMHDHQRQRQSNSMQALIGPRQAMRLNALYRKLEPLQQQWDAFRRYCAAQQSAATDWADWLQLPANDVSKGEGSQGQFRMNAPATWALSNSESYARALARQRNESVRMVPAHKLWQRFQQDQKAV